MLMEMNFISRNTSDQDKELFFGPLNKESFTIIEDHWNMAHILYAAGIFPSISQARKNGWNKDILSGFNIITVGKKAKKKTLFILNVK